MHTRKKNFLTFQLVCTIDNMHWGLWYNISNQTGEELIIEKNKKYISNIYFRFSLHVKISNRLTNFRCGIKNLGFFFITIDIKTVYRSL